MEGKPIEIATDKLILAQTPTLQNDQNMPPTQAPLNTEEEKKPVLDFSLTEEYIKEVTPILQNDKYTQSEQLYSTYQ
jgi:hypothetical protein